MRGRLLICEKSDKWTIAFRRQLDVRVHETRGAHECWSELRTNPASIVVWEATEANRDGLDWQLVEQHRQFPQSRSIVVSESDAAGYKWLWRVAGAVEVVESRRELHRAVRIIRQHLRRTTAPQPSIDEVIWANLPWSDNGYTT